MELALLGIAFAVIIVLLILRRPLYQAIGGGLIAMVLLFRMPLRTVAAEIADVFRNWSSFSILLSLYLITCLQRILEARSQIRLAQQNLNGLFHNRRVNAGGAPLFIGLLPSAAAMILCSDIVKDATDGHLEPKEQAAVTSWFRHIPESFLPTYSGVLLMTSISGIPLSDFVLNMLVPTLTLALLGWLFFLRHLTKDPGTPVSSHRGKELLGLFRHLWTLLLLLALILVAGLSIVPSVLIVILLALLVYRFSVRECFRMLRSGFELRLILNTFLVLILKEFIAWSGALETLPNLLEGLPVPTYLIFALMFFLGGIISGANGIIALGTPLAFSAIPDGGVPLMVLLMCMSHAASQISPIHVCLVVASEQFGVSMGELLRKILPLALTFCLLMLGYHQLLLRF